MTPIEVVDVVCVVALIGCTVAILVGETYHRHRKRRWKKLVQQFHEQQAQMGVTAAPAPADEGN